MKTKIIISFLTLILLSNCKEKSKIETFKKFPRKIELKGKKSGLKPLFKLATINIFDSLLIISNTKRSLNTIHLYNKKNLQKIFSTGEIGPGPKEIKNPGFYKFNQEKGSLLTPDWGRGKIFEWDLDSILQKKTTYWPNNYYVTPSSIWPITTYSFFNDSIILFRVDNPEYYFYAANNKGEVIDSMCIKDKSEIYSNINRTDLMSKIWYQHIIHPDKNKIFIAYKYADIIVGIDFKGNIIFRKQGPDMIKENPADKQLKRTYYPLKSTEKYVFGLYFGYYPRKGQKHTTKYPKKIFVYNWKGDPIVQLILEHPTMSFDIDKENNRIITYAADLGEVVCYDIPTFLL